MPNCFSLRKKGTTHPAILQDVDKEMCDHFGQPCDPKHWLAGWYNVIGCLIAVKGYALGSDDLRRAIREWYDPALYGLEEAIEAEADMLKILEWLESNYESNNWVEIGRRA